MSDSALTRKTYNTQQLVTDFPPRIANANKRWVYSIACPEGSKHGGTITLTRWPVMELPQAFRWNTRRPVIESQQDVFTYNPPADGFMEWHLNFACSDLFCAYGGGLLAQDELQVAEHPALASLREALIAQRIPALTVENGRPTPILVVGVERRCAIDTKPNTQAGRPNGLYGNNFGRAKPTDIANATHRLDPPTITNLIAMEAPPYGTGIYSAEEIRFILETAYIGFRAAHHESQSLGKSCGVHTGFWGCGAYGGNRVIMALLQFVAAGLAGLERLVFHTIDSGGTNDFGAAQRILHELAGLESSEQSMDGLIHKVQLRNFRWGASNGT